MIKEYYAIKCSTLLVAKYLKLLFYFVEIFIVITSLCYISITVSYAVCMKKYCGGDEVVIVTDLRVSRSLDDENVVFGILSSVSARPCLYLYVCVYSWMNVPLASAYRVGRIVFVFGIQEFIHPRSVPTKSEHSSTKIGALQVPPPPTQNGDVCLKTLLGSWLNFSSLSQPLNRNEYQESSWE
jgi:hypothetical protein